MPYNYARGNTWWYMLFQTRGCETLHLLLLCAVASSGPTGSATATLARKRTLDRGYTTDFTSFHLLWLNLGTEQAICEPSLDKQIHNTHHYMIHPR
jgi:hypothetical protein